MAANKNELKIKLTLDTTPFLKKVKGAQRAFNTSFAKPMKNSIAGLQNSFASIGLGVAGFGAAGFAGFSFFDHLADKKRPFEQFSSYMAKSGEEANNLELGIKGLNESLGMRGFANASKFAIQMQQLSGFKGENLFKLAESVGFLQKSFGADEMIPKAQIELMNRFGVGVTEAADAVAYLKGQGGDLRGEALESVLEYSTQFREAGFSFQQTLGVLSNANQAWSMDKVIDSIKEGRVRLMSSDKAPADALALLGLGDLQKQIQTAQVSVPKAMQQVFAELNKMSDAEAFNIAKEIFGAPIEDAGIEAVRKALEGMNKIVKYSGEAKRLEDSIKSKFSFKWDQTVTELKTSFSGLADAALPYFEPLIDGLKHAFAWAGAFFKQYHNLTNLILYSIGGVLVLGGAFLALKIVGGLAGGALNVFSMALAPLRLLKAGPIGLITVAVLALGAAFTHPDFRTGFFDTTAKSFARLGQSFREIGENSALFKDFFEGMDWDFTFKDFGTGLGHITNASMQPLILLGEGLNQIMKFFNWYDGFAIKVNSMTAGEQGSAIMKSVKGMIGTAFAKPPTTPNTKQKSIGEYYTQEFGNNGSPMQKGAQPTSSITNHYNIHTFIEGGNSNLENEVDG